MHQLTIRNVPDRVHQTLKARAEAKGTSIQKEALASLEADTGAQDRPRTLLDLAERCFGPEHGVELEIPPRRFTPGPGVSFDDEA